MTAIRKNLPLSEEGAAKPETLGVEAAVPEGAETILLVEDESSAKSLANIYGRKATPFS